MCLENAFAKVVHIGYGKGCYKVTYVCTLDKVEFSEEENVTLEPNYRASLMKILYQLL